MQVEITRSEIVAIRTGKGERSIHEEKAAVKSFILSEKIRDKKEINHLKRSLRGQTKTRFHIIKNAFQ